MQCDYYYNDMLRLYKQTDKARDPPALPPSCPPTTHSAAHSSRRTALQRRAPTWLARVAPQNGNVVLQSAKIIEYLLYDEHLTPEGAQARTRACASPASPMII